MVVLCVCIRVLFYFDGSGRPLRKENRQAFLPQSERAFQIS